MQVMRKRQGLARKRLLLGCLGIGVALLAIGGVVFGPTLRDLYNAGFDPFKESKKLKWHPDTETNLKALHTALKLHHDSEDQFPKAAQWMEAALKRVATQQLSKEEATKKFIDPAAGGAPGVYGFAMNDAAGEKYLGDLKDAASMPLLFQSTETAWNAHGDPAKIGRPGGMAISADGKIIRLPAP